MVKVLLVDKYGKEKISAIKHFEKDSLFKKCNFRNKDNFSKRNTWKLGNNEYISVFGKDMGRAQTGNKYELPPPIDKELYFGTLLILKHSSEEITNLNVENLDLVEWKKIHDKLFGGFEDLDEEEELSEEEEIPAEFLTKHGYSKEDGFVVDSDETDEDYIPNNEEEEDDDDEEEDEKVAATGEEEDEDEDEEEGEEEEDEEEEWESESDIGSELSEESFIESDDEEENN
jgi:hypothetical protein